jgi:hypothetical protein
MRRARPLERGGDELPEQGRWPFGPRLELGVVLGGDEERVIFELDRLDRRSSGEVPEIRRPAASSRLRSRLLTS